MSFLPRTLAERWRARLRAAVSRAPTTAGDEARSLDSQDDHPWQHPYLSARNIARFRAYSEAVWASARDHVAAYPRKLRCAFSVNMAQNMYKWARMAQRYGADSTLFLHAMDSSAISDPNWEEFDGEYRDLADGKGFRALCTGIVPEVRVETVPIESAAFAQAYGAYQGGNAKPLLRLLCASQDLRYEVFHSNLQFLSYFDWAQALSRFDVIYAASAPFAAYASGRPYCLFSVGGDLQFDGGRGDRFGQVMRMAFNGGRFLMASNPHTLGHSRRLGLTNAVYLPYPMDTDRYRPGVGAARAQWEADYGPGVFVLTTARLDSGVKGHSDEFFRMLTVLARERSYLRFVFLAWGHSADEFEKRIGQAGLQKQLIVLCPVGKKRLIDYYRSCDFVLDQFVYGYYGATALEAASIAKPVIMKIRVGQYAPLYAGDVAPAMDAGTADEIRRAILALADDVVLRRQRGEAMRAWVVRNHGEDKTTPLMLALLQFAADRVALPSDLINPLCDPEAAEEVAYHQSCFRGPT